MPEISAVIITCNEEKYIEQCIRSLSDVVDEVLVIDSFSTDKTREISERLGAKVILHEFEGYIEQKNWATKQARHDYILSLDGDELLSDELAGNILKMKDNMNHDGYFFNRLNNYYGSWIKHSGMYPNRKLRLFNRTSGVWGGTNPHDVFIPDKGAKTIRIGGDLLHYIYDSIDEHLEKILEFSTINAQSLYDSGKKCNILKLSINPFWRFIRDYFVNQGFRDGFTGYLICYLSAFACFLKHLKLHQLHKGGDNPVIPGFNFIKL